MTSLHRVPLAGVIGNPIAHSRSPRLHGHWLSRYQIPGHYVPLHVEGADLQGVLSALPRMGFVGANITIPHKHAVLALSDDATSTARRIGAANTLTFLPGGRLHADNTDAEGFMRNLRTNAPTWDPAATAALVLGAGGAARAVLVALLDAGVQKIFVSNRSGARAEALADEFGPCIQTVAWNDRAEPLCDVGLLVNTTSLGMVNQPALDMPLSALKPGAVVSDLVYTPLQTPLLAAAAAAGHTTVDGLGMLLYQAVPGFERWFGHRPDVDARAREAVLG